MGESLRLYARVRLLAALRTTLDTEHFAGASYRRFGAGRQWRIRASGASIGAAHSTSRARSALAALGSCPRGGREGDQSLRGTHRLRQSPVYLGQISSKTLSGRCDRASVMTLEKRGLDSGDGAGSLVERTEALAR